MENIVFILVRPQFLGNLGSAARALKNFGFSKLRLVAPPKNYKDAEARKMSVGAFDVLKHAEVFDNFEEALADITFAVATTSGRQRDSLLLPLEESVQHIADRAAQNKCAIVFGDEVNGLGRAELQRCHHTTTIRTNPEFPALNLSQAIGIFAYELSKITLASEPASYPTGMADNALFAQLDALLDSAGFTRTFNREKVIAEFRSLYQRAQPTTREADLLAGALLKLTEQAQKTRTEA